MEESQEWLLTLGKDVLGTKEVGKSRVIVLGIMTLGQPLSTRRWERQVRLVIPIMPPSLLTP